MDVFDQKKVLQSFRILVDNREQDTERARKRYAAFGVPVRRSTLNYGDYGYNATLPDGTDLFDEAGTISAPCVVERKMDLAELSQCLAQGRDRFRREFQRAAEHDATVYLVVENATWENLVNGKYRTRFNPKAFTASLVAWMIRFGITPIMCKEEVSPLIIREILYRDLKERLERGDYG